jgi:hypothetical protein
MKQVLFVFLAALILIGCGAGHANLTSITVSPQSATTTSSPQGQVGYTATENFQNGKSRELSQVDGRSWKTRRCKNLFRNRSSAAFRLRPLVVLPCESPLGTGL